MNKLCLLLTFFLSSNAFSQVCIVFHTEEYCNVWENNSNGIKTIEFVRQSESVSSWKKMITMKEYGNKKAFKEVLPSYVESIKTVLATKPEILKYDSSSGKENIYFVMFLLAPDMSHYEYVINRFYIENDSIWSVFYSEKIPFSKNVTIENYGLSKEAWIKQLSLIDVKKLL